jgi:DnaJ-class molecular chaperone
MFKVVCAKCAGKGEIKAYIGIAGGICFSCNGRGFNIQKSAPKKSPKFTVAAFHFERNEIVDPICTVTAKNEAEAVKKAIAQLSKGNAYDAKTATVKQL